MSKWASRTLLLAMLFLTLACRWTPRQEVQLRTTVPTSRLPASVEEFDCFFFSITGTGISADLDSAAASALSLGRVSNFMDLATARDEGAKFSVPAGELISLQAFGLDGKTAAESCEDLSLVDELTNKSRLIALVGTAQGTVYQDSTMVIENIYEATDEADLSGGVPLTAYNPYIGPNLSAGGAPFFSLSDWDGALPPIGALGDMTLTTLSGFIGEAAPAITIPSSPDGNHARLDLLFAIPTGNVDLLYSGISVELKVAGGAVPDAISRGCQISSPVEGVGYVFAALENSSPLAWNTNAGASIHTDIAIKSETYSQVSDYTHIDMSDPLNPLPLFFLSVRSRSPNLVGNFCSALQLRHLSAKLIPKTRKKK